MLTRFSDITLICPPSAAEAMTAALNTNPFLTSLPSPRPDLLAPQGLTQNTGTAEILRLPEVKALVTSDFVVLPCDLVCDLAGEKLLQAWMVKSASLADLLGDSRSPDSPHSGGLGVWYETRSPTPMKGQETDFIAVTPLVSTSVAPPKGSLLPHISNLVYSMPMDSLNDLVADKSALPIRHSLVRTHPRVRMLTSHRDAHIYIFPKWTMKFIDANERLESIGEDVIGWWAKAGWQTGLSDKLGMPGIFESGTSQDETSSAPDEQPSPTEMDAEGLRAESPPKRTTTPKSLEVITPADLKGQVRTPDTLLPKSSPGRVPHMLAYIHPSSPTAPLVRRVDTGQLLLATSLQLAKLPSVEEVGSSEAVSPFAHARKVAYPEGVRPRTTISRQDSLVADNVTVEEKTAIRESVVGANCQIGEGAKLLQCLLMDGVVVGRNCKLTRCVLGRRCEIGEASVLTDCEVQENLLVEPKSKSSCISPIIRVPDRLR